MAQRIALARAFIRNPDLLILDEATNAVDEETQAKIIEALHEFAAGGGIVLIVTHRPEMMQAIPHTISMNSPQADPTPALAGA
jgi:ABC-type bacteriocin/lantibiotic exporter with double-glycine peptidase domain